MVIDRQVPGRPREWDAAGYDALPLPHERWARRLLDTLPLTGDETVLDVGAGTGRDAAAMLARLRERLRDELARPAGSRLTVVQANLAEPLRLDHPVDAVFSVATLHWLPDHPAVFRSLAGVLRPGGLLRAEWGGAGNCATVESAPAALGLPPLHRALQLRHRPRAGQPAPGRGLHRRGHHAGAGPGLVRAGGPAGGVPGH